MSVHLRRRTVSVLMVLAGLMFAAGSCAEFPGSQTVDIEGVRIRYVDHPATTPSAPTVVLLHGASYNVEIWEKTKTYEALEAIGGRVVALDLPGYGHSDDWRNDSGEFLRLFLDAVGVNSAILVSPSMSGRFSLPFVRAHSDRVLGYVPVAPTQIDEFVAGGPEPVKSLVVVGSEDVNVSVEQSQSLATMLGGELWVIEGAGHACYEEQPEMFNERLVKFVRSVQGTPTS